MENITRKNLSINQKRNSKSKKFLASLDSSRLVRYGFLVGGAKHAWRTSLGSYIYGFRRGSVVFDLDKTSFLFRRALYFVQQTSAFGFPVLFVEPKAQRSVLQARLQRYNSLLKDPQLFNLVHRWPSGLLSNYFISVAALTKVIKRISLRRAFKRRISHLFPRAYPHYMVLGTVRGYDSALRDANLLNIPTIALISADVNFQGKFVTYPVLGSSYLISRLFFYRAILQRIIGSLLTLSHVSSYFLPKVREGILLQKSLKAKQLRLMRLKAKEVLRAKKRRSMLLEVKKDRNELLKYLIANKNSIQQEKVIFKIKQLLSVIDFEVKTRRILVSKDFEVKTRRTFVSKEFKVKINLLSKKVLKAKKKQIALIKSLEELKAKLLLKIRGDKQLEAVSQKEIEAKKLKAALIEELRAKKEEVMSIIKKDVAKGRILGRKGVLSIEKKIDKKFAKAKKEQIITPRKKLKDK